MKYFLDICPNILLSDEYTIRLKDAVSSAKILFWETSPKSSEKDLNILVKNIKKRKINIRR